MSRFRRFAGSLGGARRMLGNMSVSTKLIGGFGLLVAIMLLFGGFTIGAITNVLGEERVLSREYLPEAHAAFNIEALASDIALNARGYGLSGNQDYLDEARTDLASLESALQDAEALAQGSAHLTVLRSSNDKLKQLAADFKQIIDQTAETRNSRTALLATLERSASDFSQQYEKYLADLNRQLQSNLPAAGELQDRLQRIQLVNEIGRDGAAAKAMAMSGLALRDAVKLEEARSSFPALLGKLDRLRDATKLEANLEQVARLRAASGDLQQAIAGLIANEKELTQLDDKRSGIRKTLVDEARNAADASIEKGTQASNGTFSLLLTTARLVTAAMICALLVSIAGAFFLSRDILGGLNSITIVANSIAGGNFDNAIESSGSDELGVLATAMDKMQTSLRVAVEKSDALDWLKSGLSRLSDIVRGELGEQEIAERVTTEVAEYLGAAIGAFYVAEAATDPPALVLLGSYAYTRRKNLANRFALGEGLVGQAALERRQILISQVPADYIKVTSGLGESVPQHICVTPLLFNDSLKGVLELGTLGPLSAEQLEYVAQAAPGIAIALETAQARSRVALALAESQRLAIELQAQQVELQAANEELQTQQEELQSANEELEEQSRQLQESEERLKTQQEELVVTNEELEEQNKALDRQRREVEQARQEITEKAEELSLASKYKSEFLANMSHELRTPLNSLLLLALRLAENKGGNLTEEQVESAQVIHGSGNDLLKLINEILDLSKIEAGRMELNIEEVRPADLARSVRQGFAHLAEDKGVRLEVSVADDVPALIVSDFKRLEQVVRNLVSNALKFTEHGSVAVSFGPAAAGSDLSRSGLKPAEAWAIAVRDTGIGIAPSQQKIIFEAFQQADGSTSRKYGGTGLGLSISREIIRLLHGEIQLQSTPGQGSTFTVYLPVRAVAQLETADPAAEPGPAPHASAPAAASLVPDDRDKLPGGGQSILIVEDDPKFAGLLVDECRERGFLCLVCSSGEEALVTAEKYLPKGIVLDIKLPGIDGWQVLERLKANSRTRHIPIHIVSGNEPAGDALRRGAIGQLRKPVTQADVDKVLTQIADVASDRVRRVLVVEDDPAARRGIVELLKDETVDVYEAPDAEQARQALQDNHFDCMILDLALGSTTGNALLAQLAAQPEIHVPPVIIYTARDLTSAEEQELRQHSEAIILKGVRSHERLLDEVSLFLHQVVSEMPERKRQVILDLRDSDAALRDKQVLVVDDDMRTVFALSRLLADHGMVPHKAENGEKALAVLDERPGIDIVLTDIMMPVLDGFETIKRIREQQRFKRLPIIALTAKAMKGDQERCLAAGASDYMTKPVDPDRLLSMLRVWLHR